MLVSKKLDLDKIGKKPASMPHRIRGLEKATHVYLSVLFSTTL
jgi:hypothetical protein